MAQTMLNVIWACSLCDAAIFHRFLVVRAPHSTPRAVLMAVVGGARVVVRMNASCLELDIS